MTLHKDPVPYQGAQVPIFWPGSSLQVATQTPRVHLLCQTHTMLQPVGLAFYFSSLS